MLLAPLADPASAQLAEDDAGAGTETEFDPGAEDAFDALPPIPDDDDFGDFADDDLADADPEPIDGDVEAAIEEGVEEDVEKTADAFEDDGEEPDFDFDEELESFRAPTEGIEEITVTGEVLESSTQAEAAAITTFDQEELDTLGIADVDTLALNTPSLHVGQVGQQAVVTLRGVGLENLTSVGETGVGFQVDGVHLGRPSGANGAFFDLERLDVERGPQGTQGGRQTNGGRIALWSKKPEESFEAFGDVQLGNYDEYVTRGVINLPIYEDKLLTRGSVVFRSRDGYQAQKFRDYEGANPGDAQDVSTRLQARSLWWDQTIDARFIFNHGRQEGRGPALKLIGPPPDKIGNTTSQLLTTGLLGYYEDQVDDCAKQNPPGFGPTICVNKDAFETVTDTNQNRSNEQNGGTLLLNWDLPGVIDTPVSDLRLGFVGSWQQNIEDSIDDFDGTNIPDQLFEQHRNATQRSLEVFLERPDVGLWSFKVGYYYYKESIKSDVCFDSIGASSAFDLDFAGDIDTESKAAFGEVGFRPFDNLRVYGGLRYTEEEKSAYQLQTRFDTKPVPAPTDTVIGPSACGNRLRARIGTRLDNTVIRSQVPAFVEDTFKKTTPMLGFDWQVTGDSTFSFSATRGFKAGGFALGVDPFLNPEITESYQSETVWEYEISSKNELFDGRMRLNATAFWTEYDPFQICQFNGPVFFCRSDGSATVRGIELEWIANPTEELQINGFFDFLDARINSFKIIDPTERQCQFGAPNPDGTCGVLGLPPSAIARPLATDVSGNTLPKAPSWAGSLGIQYLLDFGRWGAVIPRFQTQFQGKTYYRVFNKEEFSQDPFIKFDAKLTWRSANDRFSGELFVVNLTNEDVINSLVVGPQGTGGQVLGQYQPPRTIGMRLSVNYLSDLIGDLF